MCLFVRMLISRTTRPNFIEFYLHVIYDHNPVWIFLPLIGGFLISLIVTASEVTTLRRYRNVHIIIIIIIKLDKAPFSLQVLSGAVQT